jgi:hypothetical protein
MGICFLTLDNLAERLDRAWREAHADPPQTLSGPEVIGCPQRVDDQRRRSSGGEGRKQPSEFLAIRSP